MGLHGWDCKRDHRCARGFLPLVIHMQAWSSPREEGLRNKYAHRCTHTAHTQATASVWPVHTVLSSFHCCNPSKLCPSDRYTLHLCVVAACHLIHTLPPGIHVTCPSYERLLSNTYFSLGLRRPQSRKVARQVASLSHSALAIDLPGFGRVRNNMSDEDAPAARGGFGGRACRHVDRDDYCHCP